jgi:hypothetical protein
VRNQIQSLSGSQASRNRVFAPALKIEHGSRMEVMVQINKFEKAEAIRMVTVDDRTLAFGVTGTVVQAQRMLGRNFERRATSR